MITASIMVVACLLAFWIWRVVSQPPDWAPDRRVWDSPGVPPDTDDARAAVHEVGHVVCAWACTDVGNVESAVICPTGGTTTFTMRDGDRQDLLWCRLIIKLGGVAGEAMVYDLGAGADALDRGSDQPVHSLF